MTKILHEGRIVPTGDGWEWKAICSCGWTGKAYNMEDEAKVDWMDHLLATGEVQVTL